MQCVRSPRPHLIRRVSIQNGDRLRLGIYSLLALWLMIQGAWFPGLAQEGPTRSKGLLLTVSQEGQSDHLVWPNVQFHVSEGNPPSPFLTSGRFEAVWEGFLQSELRSTYGFHLEFSGELELTLNDRSLWKGVSEGKERISTDTLRLGKGENALKVAYKSPESGDAHVRLYWSGRDMPINPVPYNSLTHTSTVELERSQLNHRGRDLFVENRCASCHVADLGSNAIPELSMDAPSLTGIGGRRRGPWLKEWLTDPSVSRQEARMPQLFHGESAQEQIHAVAAFLSSLQKGESHDTALGDAAKGRDLFLQLRCQACHEVPGGLSDADLNEVEAWDEAAEDSLVAASDGDRSDRPKISQKDVRNKFAGGALVDFLLKPEAHYAWIRMPNFRLNPEEASHLAAFLEAHADEPQGDELKVTPDLLARGREYVETVGCLNCHALEGMKTRLEVPTLATLKADSWTRGCMSDEVTASARHPKFRFTGQDRRALQAFAATDRSSLGRHVAADFVLRHADRLNCRECHTPYQEAFPAYDILGGKLKPEWATRFLAGEVDWKPRPWLDARMPAFPAYAAGFGEGLASLHGWPEKTPEEPEPNPEDVLIGRALIGTSGFSCVSCHAVGAFEATQVFEAPGIDLSHSFDRLQWDYFQRWILNPMRVDPTTKMPGFFDDQGNSPLTEYYEGAGPRTIRGMWEYLKLGSEMPLPE